MGRIRNCFWHRVGFALVLAMLPGCRHWTMFTSSKVTVDEPIQTHVACSPAPLARTKPLELLPIDGEAPAGGPRVAIVDVDGLLLNQNFTGIGSVGENPVALFREKLQVLAKNSDVCAVVLRINSPGGGVAATDLMWHELRTFRERTKMPVVACLLDLGTGGGYYLASAADTIVASPNSITGGVGVIYNSYNLRDFMATFNVIPQTIKAGSNIDMGTSVHAISTDTKRLLQTMADEFHQRFKAVIVQSRPGLNGHDETLFDGRVYTAQQALQRGLIDQVGYVEDAVAKARELAGQPRAQAVLCQRKGEGTPSPYAILPNTPLQQGLWPANLPGIERSRLPTFLYLWQPEPTLEKLGGR